PRMALSGILVRVKAGGGGAPNGPPAPPPKLALPRLEQPQQSGAYRADPASPTFSPSFMEKDQNDLFAFEAIGITLCRVLADSVRNLRMLRAAWRMRCSFSTSAMRT